MVSSTLAAQTKQINKIYFAEQLSLDDLVTSYPSELNQPGYIFYTFSVTPNTVDSIISSQQLGKVAGANVTNIRIQLLSVIFGPRREKTCLWGFRQSEIQTSLLSYRD